MIKPNAMMFRTSKKVIPKTKLSTWKCNLLLAIGATSGTQKVRIVGIDSNFSDRDPINVKVEK